MNKGEVFKFRMGRTIVLSQGHTQNLADLFNLFNKAKADFRWLSLDKVNLGKYNVGTTDVNWINFEVDEGVAIPKGYTEVVSLNDILKIIDR